MRATLARLGDAMLSHVLPAAEAGACSACVGQYCGCYGPCGIHGGHFYCTQHYYSCYCACQPASGLLCSPG
jgi:hypothetical protein